MADDLPLTAPSSVSSEQRGEFPVLAVLASIVILTLATGVVPFPAERGAGVALATLALTAVTVAALFVVGVLDGRGGLSPRRRRRFGALAVCTAGLVACVQAVLSGRPWPGLTVMLALAGGGLLPMARRAYPVLVAGVTLAWVCAGVNSVVVGRPPGRGLADEAEGWLPTTAAVLGAAALGLLVQNRRRAAVLALHAADRTAEALRVRDVLTGAANRRGLGMVAVPMLENARRQGDATHCLFIDVDDLTAVNAALGHGDGDEVILAVADSLRHCVRSTDVVSRWAGDQFVVIGPGTGMSPLELERRVRGRLTDMPAVPAEVWSPRISVGSATLVPWDDGDLDTLLSRAQQDMNLRRSLRRQSALPRRDGVLAATPEPHAARPDPARPDPARPDPAHPEPGDLPG